MINTDKIKDSVNIVDIIDGYIGLKKTGKNHSACCPFHGEKTPSFTVTEDKQFYHCFGCGANGDVIDFIMEYTGCDFKEAVTSIDSHAFIDNVSRKVTTPVRKIRLPLGHKGFTDEAHEILAKCQSGKGCFFTDKYQVVPLTDLNGLLVSLAMIEGRGFDVRYLNKQFIYGSCLILGPPGKVVVLVRDYFVALKIYNKIAITGACVICAFETLNIRQIVNQLNQKKIKYQFFCENMDDLYEADHLNIDNVLYESLNVTVDVRNKLNVMVDSLMFN